MNVWQTIRIAIRALLRAPLRALLTLLGIVIGIGAVLAMVALGEGTRAGLEAQLSSLGSNMVVVFPGATLSSGVRMSNSGVQLTDTDAESMRQLTTLRATAPVLRTTGQVVSSRTNWSTTFIATSPDYIVVRDWPVERGTFFTDTEYRNGGKVCVLGSVTARELFGDEDPIGEKIRVKQMNCEVIGVLSTKGGSAMGQDQDDALLLPLTTYRNRIQGSSNQNVHMIIASANSADTTAALLEEITVLLRQRHKLREEESNDFTLRDMKEVAKAAGEQTAILSVLLGGIASISLIVGGIGIMNIMLVSVTERTKEIGIRMAVGAKAKDILAQFLAEALILSLIGGLLGIGLGMGAASAFETFMGWATTVSPQMIVLSVSVAAAVGIIFGIAPAWKAAKLDPIDALRHE